MIKNAVFLHCICLCPVHHETHTECMQPMVRMSTNQKQKEQQQQQPLKSEKENKISYAHFYLQMTACNRFLLFVSHHFFFSC